MEKKEYYRHILPHYQQPGQAYFVTWNLKDAVPKKALKRYSRELEILRTQETGAASSDSLNEKRRIGVRRTQLRKQYIKAYNDLLDAERHPKIDLSKPEITIGLLQTLRYWHGKSILHIACCIMPNHVHWVLQLYEKDENGNPVYLQDIMESVKRFSANAINQIEHRKGTVWQKENFDTTIRGEDHLNRAINYTINNPVKAGWVCDWHLWPGTFCDDKYIP